MDYSKLEDKRRKTLAFSPTPKMLKAINWLKETYGIRYAEMMRQGMILYLERNKVFQRMQAEQNMQQPQPGPARQPGVDDDLMYPDL